MSSLFQEQRNLRQQREVAIRRGVVAVLDIGTTKLACLILQFVPPPANDAGAAGVKMPHASAFRVIGVGTVQSHGVEFGWLYSSQERIDIQDRAKRITQKIPWFRRFSFLPH